MRSQDQESADSRAWRLFTIVGGGIGLGMIGGVLAAAMSMLVMSRSERELRQVGAVLAMIIGST